MPAAGARAGATLPMRRQNEVACAGRDACAAPAASGAPRRRDGGRWPAWAQLTAARARPARPMRVRRCHRSVAQRWRKLLERPAARRVALQVREGADGVRCVPPALLCVARLQARMSAVALPPTLQQLHCKPCFHRPPLARTAPHARPLRALPRAPPRRHARRRHHVAPAASSASPPAAQSLKTCRRCRRPYSDAENGTSACTYHPALFTGGELGKYTGFVPASPRYEDRMKVRLERARGGRWVA